MALPDRPVSSWFQGMDLPNSLFGTGGTDYELYEENDEFVLIRITVVFYRRLE